MSKLFSVTLDHSDASSLYYACHVALERWPGAPQRPYEEQEALARLKSMFFAIQLESRVDLED